MSAPAPTMLNVQQFLTKNGMTLVTHPPYSLDLALRDFFLFLQMKKVLKKKRLADMDEVKQKVTEALTGITINECTHWSSGEKSP